MTNSKQIAKLLGPSLIAITLPEAFNVHIFDAQIAPVVYLNGGVLFVAGLSIILAHNRWVRDWSVAITLVGWCVILLGFLRLFFTELAMQGGQNNTTVIISALTGAAIGVFLTYKAYSREDSKTVQSASNL